MGALKDPYIGDCINKLVAAGVVKMGWMKSKQIDKEINFRMVKDNK